MKDYPFRINYAQEKSAEKLSEILQPKLSENTVIVCVGTDRCIGDVLGPLVGTMLQERNFRFPVYGTLDNPIHAVNLHQSLKNIQFKHPQGFFVAIDACLGAQNLVGNIHIKDGPIYPGKGVGKKLPRFGNLSIVGIVDKINNEDCFAIHNIRLSLVMKIAKTIVDALMLATYLS